MQIEVALSQEYICDKWSELGRLLKTGFTNTKHCKCIIPISYFLVRINCGRVSVNDILQAEWNLKIMMCSLMQKKFIFLCRDWLWPCPIPPAWRGWGSKVVRIKYHISTWHDIEWFKMRNDWLLTYFSFLIS